MIGAAKKWSTAALAVNRRISVGGSILGILVIGEGMLVHLRHFT